MQAFAFDNYAQSKRMDVKIERSSIVSALEQIEAQSEFFFFYNNKVIKLDKEVSLNLKAKTIDEILNAVFKDTDIAYTINNRQIILSGKDAGRSSAQQPNTISGKVTDMTGVSLPGVSVVVKGTTIGTITDINGNYSLNSIPENAILQFSFVGMKTQEIKAAGKSVVNLSLEDGIISLDEVVAVGYGTVRKADLTGAISSVSAKNFDRIPASTPLQALQGRAAGVQITTNSGVPGASASVLIRGVKSITGSNAPIYVIDGVISTTIDNLDPNSIESVSVLKDASSSAIYGARAANGVVLITTKRGAGKRDVEITLNSYYGVQTESNLKLKLLNSSQYLELYTEAYTNKGLTIPWNDQILEHYKGVDTDWQDLMLQNGIIQNHNLSVTGGSEKSNYYISAGYLDQKGRIIETGYKKYNLTFNTDHKVNNWIKFGNSLNIYSNKREATQDYGGVVTEPYNMALRKAPITRAYEEDGDYGHIYDTSLEHMHQNPIWMAKQTVNESSGKGLQGSLYLTIEPLKGLEFTARGSMDYNNYYFSYFKPGLSPIYGWEGSAINSIEKYHSETVHWITDFLMNYSKSINNHNLKFLLGYSLEENVNETLAGTRTGTPNNQIHFLSAGDPVTQTNSNGYTDWSFVSQFTRLNYDYKSKYLLSASVRRDGTSRLQESSRYGIFPSASLAWRASEEEFLKDVGFIDDLKVRASYGYLGNIMSVGAYGTIPTLSGMIAILNNAPVPAYTLNAAVNRDLKWESALKKNIGVDATFWNNRVYGSVDYFIEDINDLLFSNPIPKTSGLLTEPLINAAKMRNKGYEVELGFRESKADWNFDLSFNLSHVKNEVTDLKGRNLKTSGLLEGYPAYSFFGYKSNGIIYDASQLEIYKTGSFTTKQVGDIALLDIDGYDASSVLTGVPDGKVDAADRTLIGQKYPNLHYGGLATVGFKNWSFQVHFQGITGFDKAVSPSNWQGVSDLFTGTPKNQDARILNRYEATKNPTGTYPRLSIGDTGKNLEFSEFWLEDASYLRIKNVNLNYNLSKDVCRQISMKGLGLYVSVQNAYTFTRYTGPEVDTTADPLVGVTQPRIWTLGLKATF